MAQSAEIAKDAYEAGVVFEVIVTCSNERTNERQCGVHAAGHDVKIVIQVLEIQVASAAAAAASVVMRE